MTDSQTVYDNYVNEFGFAPKQTGHLIAFAKKSGAKLKFSEARQIIAANANGSNKNEKKASNPSSVSRPPSKPMSNKSNASPTKKKWPPVATGSKSASSVKSSSPSKSSINSKPPPSKPTTNAKIPSSKPVAKKKWPPVQTNSANKYKSSAKPPTKAVSKPPPASVVSSQSKPKAKKWPPVQSTAAPKTVSKPPPKTTLKAAPPISKIKATATTQLKPKPVNNRSTTKHAAAKPPPPPSTTSVNNGNDSKLSATEQARLEAMERLSSSNSKFASKAKAYNKPAASSKNDNPSSSKPPPAPTSTNSSISAMEQARIDAMARLSTHSHNSASKAKAYNKVDTKPPAPPSPSNDDDKEEDDDTLSPSERGRPSDAKFPPPPPKKSSVNSVESPVSAAPISPPISPPVSPPKAPKSRPKIPKQPTIIITKKKSGAAKPPPPPSMSNAMDDEKTGLPPPVPADAVPPKFLPPPKGDASNIIICRVNYECKSQKGKQDLYEALSTFVKLQLDAPHPGTLTYHFTCPNPVKYPLKLEFIELYYNEHNFWEHSNSTTFHQAYFKAFARDKHCKSKTFVTLGVNLSSKVKQTTKGIGSTFPKIDAGYLLHDECFKALDYADDTKLMFKFHMIAPKYSQGNTKNVELIFDIMERMSVYAKQSYAVMFSTHRLDEKTYPHHLELISIWPNIQCLIEFLQNEKVQAIIYEFKELMISQTDKMNRKNHFLCELYSNIEVNEEVMGMIKMVFDDIGYTQHLKTDVGYILHPKANSSQLK